MSRKTESGSVEFMFRLPFPAPGHKRNTPRTLAPPDGKYYVSDTEFGHGTLFVGRVHDDGTPDESFGGVGWRAETLAMGSGEAAGLLLRDDGGVVAAMTNQSGLGLVRFKDDGTLDPSFGEDGRIVHHAEGLSALSQRLVPGVFALGGAGGVYPGEQGMFYGLTSAPYGPVGTVMRCRADGRLDPGFNGNGMATIEHPSATWGTAANSMVLMPDGCIVVVGTINPLLQRIQRVYFCRLHPDGSLDETYGENGYAIFDYGALGLPQENVIQMKLNHAALMMDGTVVACGDVMTGVDPHSYRFHGLVISADSSGRLNGSFNNGRPVMFGLLGDVEADFRLGGIGVQSDGRIVCGGGVTDLSSRDREMLAVRFLPTGSVDSSFAGRGWFTSRPYGARVTFVSDVTIEPAGNILLTGAGGSDYGVNTQEGFVFRLGTASH